MVLILVYYVYLDGRDGLVWECGFGFWGEVFGKAGGWRCGCALGDVWIQGSWIIAEHKRSSG